MKCPYLQEVDVSYCRNSVVCKMIIRTPAKQAQAKCVSAAYRDCALFREHPEEAADSAPCPFLKEAPVQYCGAAPVRKYVPHSGLRFSRCEGGGHRFCDVYLRAQNGGPVAGDDAPHTVQGLPAPHWLFYSPNHMWLEQAEDGSCQIGVDAFLAKVLGSVEQVNFVTCPGVQRPAATLTARGIDVPMVFPNLVAVTGPNHTLRRTPAQLTSDPYGLGWLFEGEDADHAGLIPGAQARAWMTHEVERLAEFVRGPAGWRPSMLDGGELDSRLLDALDREEKFRLFHEFFSPYAGGRGRS